MQKTYLRSMARIMAIDYGLRRTGIAVTDPLQIIATGLCTVTTHGLMPFLEKYFKREAVEKVLIGAPVNLDGSDTHATRPVQNFIKGFTQKFPHLPLQTVDERYTSKMARQSMLEMGLKKKDRENKALLDEVAATIILQDYLNNQ
jgi:putative holliday junction resolvase